MRTLTPNQRTTLQQAIAGFAGTKVSLSIPSDHPEAQSLADELNEVFTAAGWQCAEHRTIGNEQDVPPSRHGVHVSVGKEEMSLDAAAITLMEALWQVNLIRPVRGYGFTPFRDPRVADGEVNLRISW